MKDDNRRKKKIIMITVAIILVIAAVICAIYFGSKIRATTMRILRLEGEVTLEENGKSKSVRENLRLNSGNALSTAVKSLVSIGLDDTKIITLDELSRAVFSQAGRKLDLELTDGSLFFEVQKPLEDDEKLDIRTSTMIVGIRGTSGWISVEGDHESMIVSDGHVHIIGTNHVTGEQKEIEVFSGQRISTYLYNDREVDSIMFYLEQVTERDLPEFMLERLRENPELLDKVCKETGWDKPWILGIKMSGITPTPAPTEAPDKDADKTEAEITPTATPTSTPTIPVQDDVEALLAMITPTPTPTPAPIQESNDDGDEDEEDEEEAVPQASPQPGGGQGPPPPVYSTNPSYNAAEDTHDFNFTGTQQTYNAQFPSASGVDAGNGYKIYNISPVQISITSDKDVKVPFDFWSTIYDGVNIQSLTRIKYRLENVDDINFASGSSGNVYSRIGGNTDLVKSVDSSGNVTYSYGDSSNKYTTKTESSGEIVLSNPVSNTSPTTVSISKQDGNITETP